MYGLYDKYYQDRKGLVIKKILIKFSGEVALTTMHPPDVDTSTRRYKKYKISEHN